MPAIVNYTTLSAAINDWDARSHDVDELVGLAEAEFRLYFGPSYAKEASTTLTFASGSCAIPAGYIRSLGLSHATYGPLMQASISAVRERRINVQTGIPSIYAIFGSTIEVAPSYDGDLTFDYEGTLTGLSSGNQVNWLITNAPQAYLSMCMSMAKAKYEDFQEAALYKAEAMRVLDALAIQSVVAQQGRASVTLPGSTP